MHGAVDLFNQALSACQSAETVETSPIIAPLQAEEWTEAQARLFDYLQSVNQQATKPLNMLQTVAHHPALFDVFLAMSTQLGANTLICRRDLELLALRTAWHTRSLYEWAHHYDYGLEAGLNKIEMASLLEEVPTADWNPREALLIRAADQLCAGNGLDSATMQQLLNHYQAAEVIEIIFVVNQYQGLSKVANSLAMALDAGYA